MGLASSKVRTSPRCPVTSKSTNVPRAWRFCWASGSSSSTCPQFFRSTFPSPSLASTSRITLASSRAAARDLATLGNHYVRDTVQKGEREGQEERAAVTSQRHGGEAWTTTPAVLAAPKERGWAPCVPQGGSWLSLLGRVQGTILADEWGPSEMGLTSTPKPKCPGAKPPLH